MNVAAIELTAYALIVVGAIGWAVGSWLGRR